MTKHKKYALILAPLLTFSVFLATPAGAVSRGSIEGIVFKVLVKLGVVNSAGVPTAGSQTLAQTLTTGNVTNGTDISLSTGDNLTSVASLDVIAGAAPTPTSIGNPVIITGGPGGATSGGGGVVIIRGGFASDGNGGQLSLSGSNATGTNRVGGLITVGAGSGTGSGDGGSANISGGISGPTGTGGQITLLSGGTTTGTAGQVRLDTGVVSGGGTAGTIEIGATSAGAVAIGRNGVTTTFTGTANASILDGVARVAAIQDSAGTLRITPGTATQFAAGGSTEVVIHATDGVRVDNDSALSFASGEAFSTGAETWVESDTPGTVFINSTKAGGGDGTLRAADVQAGATPNGAYVSIKSNSELLATTSGFSATTTGLIPAGVHVLFVTARVTTAVTTTVGDTFDVGDSGDPNRYGATIAGALNTTVDETDATADPRGTWSSSAREVILDATATAIFTGGAVRVTVFYLDPTPPGS